jgi:hypothetical protein
MQREHSPQALRLGQPPSRGAFAAPSGRLRASSSRARKDFLHGLYDSQLRNEAGARYVRSFEMRNKKDATDYYLFFATDNAKGMEKMKQAMWKVDESGESRFSDATNPATPVQAGSSGSKIRSDVIGDQRILVPAGTHAISPSWQAPR